MLAGIGDILKPMPAVKLLSSPVIFLDESQVTPPKGKTSALLYYLAYQGDWVSRNDLVYLLWPDMEEQNARRNLRQLLSSIRNLKFATDVEITEQHLRWLVDTDVQVFKNAIDQTYWAKAVQSYVGILLEDFQTTNLPEFDSWLELERLSLFQTYRRAVYHCTEELKAKGHFEQAITLFKRLSSFDPLDEDVLRNYLELLNLASKRLEALDIYETFKQRLTIELDIEPEVPTQELVEQLRLESSSVKGKVASSTIKENPSRSPQWKMPKPVTHFVGRESEIDHVIQSLHNPACRLLTIVAAGGMGKTRLAIEVAKRLEPDFADGVCFIPFESVTSAELMVSAIANALDFSFFGKQDPKEQLLNYLKDKTILLIADNLEHLQDGASVLSEVLEIAPEIRILATSREHLNLHAEWLYDLMGMDTSSESNDAITFFVQTAKKARISFQLDENLETVTTICQYLGGMPLAIELAASWLRVLTPQDIATELLTGIGSLKTSIQDMPERHHDVHSVFDSSWQRLTLSEQRALKHLAVFHDGFDKNSAQTVAQVSLPLLFGLSNKSFLRRDDTGRFSQHPLMWQFIRVIAEEDSLFEVVQEKHAQYFAEFLKEHEDEHEGLEVVSLQQDITIEIANILAAWAWMVEHKREDLIELALWGLCEYYRGLHLFQEGEALFSYAEKQLDKNGLIRARLLHRLGIFHDMLGTYEEGLVLLNESIALSQQHQSSWDEAHALLVWGYNRIFVGLLDDETCFKIYKRAEKLFKASGDRYGEARAVLGYLGAIKDKAKSEQRLRECIDVFREEQGHFGLDASLARLALYLAFYKGEFQEASDLLEECISNNRKRKLIFYLVFALNSLGQILTFQGKLDKAETYLEESLDLSRNFGLGKGIILPKLALDQLGWLAFAQLDYNKAKQYWLEALDDVENDSNLLSKAETMTALCKLAIVQTDIEQVTLLCQKTELLLDQSHQHYELWFEAKCAHLQNLADIALLQGHTENAKAHLHEALVIANEWTIFLAQFNILLIYSDLFQQKGDSQKAVKLLCVITNHEGCPFATKQAAKKRLEILTKTVEESIDVDITLTLEQTKIVKLEDVVQDLFTNFH